MRGLLRLTGLISRLQSRATGALFLFITIIFIVIIHVGAARAETAAFDLIGPKVEVRVQREGVTLPIAEVPSLQVHDRLWIHPDLPENQSVHYLMVVVFLRGATNPPTDAWFTRVETWSKPVHDEGIFVVVPEGAEEALVFLAPDTGGAYSTLRTAVRGKPGAFVRAAQDLEQASLDRQRLEKYLEAVREISTNDPEQLKSRTTFLARSLSIRLDQQCFDKPSAQQAPCLTQNTDQLVLDDAHSQTMVATLTSGPSSDLLAQISSTPNARSGYYSPYVERSSTSPVSRHHAHCAVSIHSGALAAQAGRPESAPEQSSFVSQSQVGSGDCSAAGATHPAASAARRGFCSTILRGQAVAAASRGGCSVVFGTELAHEFVLHVETKSGPGIDLPARADAMRGGFAVETKAMQAADLDGEVTGILRGTWGFHPSMVRTIVCAPRVLRSGSSRPKTPAH